MPLSQIECSYCEGQSENNLFNLWLCLISSANIHQSGWRGIALIGKDVWIGFDQPTCLVIHHQSSWSNHFIDLALSPTILQSTTEEKGTAGQSKVWRLNNLVVISQFPRSSEDIPSLVASITLSSEMSRRRQNLRVRLMLDTFCPRYQVQQAHYQCFSYDLVLTKLLWCFFILRTQLRDPQKYFKL